MSGKFSDIHTYPCNLCLLFVSVYVLTLQEPREKSEKINPLKRRVALAALLVELPDLARRHKDLQDHSIPTPQQNSPRPETRFGGNYGRTARHSSDLKRAVFLWPLMFGFGILKRLSQSSRVQISQPSTSIAQVLSFVIFEPTNHNLMPRFSFIRALHDAFLGKTTSSASIRSQLDPSAHDTTSEQGLKTKSLGICRGITGSPLFPPTNLCGIILHSFYYTNHNRPLADSFESGFSIHFFTHIIFNHPVKPQKTSKNIQKRSKNLQNIQKPFQKPVAL